MSSIGADIGSLSSSAYGQALERKLNCLQSQAQSASSSPSSSSLKTSDRHINKLQNYNNVPENKDSESSEKKTFLYSESLSHYINNLPANELIVTVCKNDFLVAVQNIKPSVTRSELDHYEALGREFNDLNV